MPIFYPNLRFRLLFIILISTTAVTTIHGFPSQVDLFEKYRSGRYAEILRYYGSGKPNPTIDRFILAESARIQYQNSSKGKSDLKQGERLDSEVRRIVSLYFSVLDLSCLHLSSSAELKGCLSRLPDGSATQLLQRLALQRLAEFMASHNQKEIALKLLQKSDLTPNDPISQLTALELMGYYLDFNALLQAEELAVSSAKLKSGELERMRGRIFYKNSKRNKALEHYLESARLATGNRLRKSLTREIKKNFPELFQAEHLSKNNDINRRLLLLSENLGRSELSQLKKTFPVAELIRTTTYDSLRTDGFFLIKTHQSSQLDRLARKNSKRLTEQPEQELLDWINQLGWDRNYSEMSELFKLLPDAKKNNYNLWKKRIELRKRSGNQRLLFNEVVNFLKVFHYDDHVYDELITILIGNNPEKPSWNKNDYWKKAFNDIPEQTGKGRYIFWLRQLMLHKNNQAGLEKLSHDFYSQAPGSYYSHEFWQENPAGDFIAEWRAVKDRSDYLSWISRFGGSSEARRFLSRQNYNQHHNLRGRLLWKEITSSSTKASQELVTLYRLGEYELARKFFSSEYKNKNLSKPESYARQLLAGIESGNLFISVYYLRQLMRNLQIPEDPFSLPEPLLKNLYPQPYRSIAARYSRKYGIDINMIYALMRQESMFRELAVSRSGASGLMQVMPATGAWLAGKLKIKEYDLHDPEISIHLGAKYFSDLLQQHSVDFRQAAIAYNGGPGNLRKWKRKFYRGNVNTFLEAIPWSESRNYCRKTFQNYQHYQVTYLLYP